MALGRDSRRMFRQLCMLKYIKDLTEDDPACAAGHLLRNPC